MRNDVVVAGGGHKNVGLVGSVFHGYHAIAFHRRLQRQMDRSRSTHTWADSARKACAEPLPHITIAFDQDEIGRARRLVQIERQWASPPIQRSS